MLFKCPIDADNCPWEVDIDPKDYGQEWASHFAECHNGSAQIPQPKRQKIRFASYLMVLICIVIIQETWLFRGGHSL